MIINKQMVVHGGLNEVNDEDRDGHQCKSQQVQHLDEEGETSQPMCNTACMSGLGHRVGTIHMLLSDISALTRMRTMCGHAGTARPTCWLARLGAPHWYVRSSRTC